MNVIGSMIFESKVKEIKIKVKVKTKVKVKVIEVV